MQLLTLEDVHSRTEYETIRPTLRRQILAQKAHRRIEVGAHCSVHFENYDTMSYQVHEMLRAENRWEERGAIEDELCAYNPLIPGNGTLSATVMFEYPNESERQEQLRLLVGIDQHLWLHIADTPPVQAVFATEQMDPDKISSVQYVHWRLSDEQRRLLKQDGTVVRLVFDHPHYAAQAVLSEASRKAIMHDPD